jgi:NADP-dependent 3-hydroxy acid dehydrogenase YdfG
MPIEGPSPYISSRGRHPAPRRSIPQMGIDINGRVALITGASSGFGEAVALGLTKAGAKVALAARREDRLRDLAARIDRSRRPGPRHRRRLQRRGPGPAGGSRDRRAAFGRLDILINNAGVMYLEPVASADLARWRSMIELNLLGLIAATQAALPGMTARQDGHIVNIASTAAMSPIRWRPPIPPPSSGCWASPNPCARKSTRATSG